MPLSRDGDLANLFTAVQAIAPDLQHRLATFDQPHGMVCEGLHLHIALPPPTRDGKQILSLTLLKLDAQRLMVVLSDVTQAVERERELRHSQAWIHAIVSSLTDYALVPLDERGHERKAAPGCAGSFARSHRCDRACT